MLTDKLSVSHAQWAHMVAPTDSTAYCVVSYCVVSYSMVWCCMVWCCVVSYRIILHRIVSYRLYTSCVYSSPAVAHVLPLLPMVWPGVERDDPSGDGWKGCWTLVLMILARTRGRGACQRIQEGEGRERAVEDEAVSRDSGQRLRHGGGGERWRWRWRWLRQGWKKALRFAFFGGSDPANKA